MIKCSLKEFEKRLGRNLKKNIICLGVDPASKTGWCIVETNDTDILFDYGTIHIDSTDVYFKYNQLIKLFENLVKTVVSKSKNKTVIVEDCWLGKNVAALKMLARIGMIVYTISHQHSISVSFLTPVQSRNRLGFKGNVKKQIFQAEAIKKLKLELDDEDAIDALVLSLNGIIEDMI